MSMHDAVVVLADIGGYTRFIKLHGMALVHAESVVTTLLESVIDQTEHPLVFNKLEGAVLFYALADDSPQTVAESALRQVNGFFQAFETRKREIGVDAFCNCGACTEVVNLDIKAVMAYGSVVLRKVKRFEEISGTPVIVAHRLLKNSVPLDEYVLVAESVEKLLGGSPSEGIRTTEQCEGIGPVNAVYYPPNPVVHTSPKRSIKRGIRLAASTISYMVGTSLPAALGLGRKPVFRNLTN